MHREYTVVYSQAKQTTRLGHWGIAQLHTVVQTRAEERENINWEGGNPDHQGYPPPPYLLKLSWFGSGPTGPSFTPRFPLLHTQKQHAAQEVSCSSRLTNMYILNRPAHAHTREVNNPPWSVWPVGEVKPMGMFPIEGFTQWCKLLVHPILVVRKFAS